MEWPDTSKRERAVAELTQGRELASQLRMIIDNRADSGVGSAEVIVNKILGSFANTLWILKGKDSDQERVSDQNHASSGGGSGGGVDSSSWGASLHQHDAVKCEDDSQESSKSSPIIKDRRGSYKRRKTSHSWTIETPSLTDDGHSWRKYGQKIILNANHPRNYFRCTHKYDQACKATKHVQKIQDHPLVFRTTYYGNHICRDYLRASELIVDCSSPRDASNVISFDNTFVANNKQDHPFLSAFSVAVKKEELVVKEELRAHSPPRDYHVSSDAMPFESPGGRRAFSSTMDDFDQEAVISGFINGAYGLDDGVMPFAF